MGIPNVVNSRFCNLKLISQHPMIVLMQVVIQNIQKIQISTTSDLKCSKKNMNHVVIRLMGLQ